MSSADTPSRRTEACAARPGHGEPERDRAGMGDDDLEARRLGDDRHVAGHARADRGEHALATVLLRGHAGDENLAVEPLREARVARAPGPRRGSTRRRPSCRRRRGRTADRRPAPTDHGSSVPRRGVARPARRPRAHEHDPPAAGPAQPAEHDRQPVARHLLAGPVRVARGPRPGPARGAPPRHPTSASSVGHQVLDRALVAGDARDPNEPRQRVDRPARVDRRSRLLRDPILAPARASPGASHRAGSAGSCTSGRRSR